MIKYFLLFFVFVNCVVTNAKKAYLVYVDSTLGPGMYGHVLMYFSDQEIDKSLNRKYFISEKIPGDIYTFYIDLPDNQEMDWKNIFEFRAKSKFEKLKAHDVLVDYLIRQNREVYFHLLNLNNSEIEKLKSLVDHEVEIKKEYSNFNFNNTCASNFVKFINAVVTPERIINQRIYKKWIMQNNTYGLIKIQHAYHSNNPVILNYSLKNHPISTSDPIHFQSKELQLAGFLQSLKTKIINFNKFCNSESIFKILVRKSIYNDVNRPLETLNIIQAKCFGSISEADLENFKNEIIQINRLSKIQSVEKKSIL